MSEDDIQSEAELKEAELKEALDYFFDGIEFEIKSGKTPPSSEEVTNQAIKSMQKQGMLNKNMSPEEVKNNFKEFLKSLKGGSRTRSRSIRKSRTRRRKRSSRKKRSTRRRRR